MEHAIIDGVKNEGYVKLTSKCMVGCYLGVYVQAKIIDRIGDVKITKVKTGVWGSTGNKGAVVCSIEIDGSKVMLMNCHLMSGKNKA